MYVFCYLCINLIIVQKCLVYVVLLNKMIMWTTSCISSCCKSQDLKQRASRTPSKWWRLLKSSLSSLKPFSSHIHILSTYIINIITPSLRNTSHIFKKNIIEGSLEVKLPTIWTDEKQSREEAERRERVRRKKMQVREKVGKSRNTVFFRCGSGGLKSRLAKAAGAETSREMRDEKLHAVVARSTFGSKMC